MDNLSSPLFVLAILCLLAVLSEWLVRHTFCKPFGTALLVILLTAVVANAGLLPSASNASPVYDVIFSYVAPVSIFFLLLEVSLKNLRQAGCKCCFCSARRPRCWARSLACGSLPGSHRCAGQHRRQHLGAGAGQESESSRSVPARHSGRFTGKRNRNLSWLPCYQTALKQNLRKAS